MGAVLGTASLSGYASIIAEDAITGADMAGIEVEAFFEDSTSELAIWEVTDTDGSVPNGEGFAGAATGTGWSLGQRGFTQGNFLTGGTVLGLWTFNNIGADSAITGFRVSGTPGGIVFDTIFVGLGGDEGTPGSSNGRPYLPDPTSDVGSSGFYSDFFNGPDLFSTLNVTFDEALTVEQSVRYLADTDALATAVPAPHTAVLVLAGLLATSRLRRKQEGEAR